MKNLSLFAIPVFVVIVLLAVAFVWKVMQPPPAVTTSETLPNSLRSAQGEKPSNPFSFLFGSGATPIPTPTPATAAAMNADLQTVGDDGGAADFSSLTSDAGSL